MNVTWILPDGRKITAQVRTGQTLMEAARANRVPLILGECGGNMACATCHVLVDPAFAALTGTPSGFEDAMLDATEAPRAPASRLSCQLTARDEWEGLILRVPQP